jgi:hypothetical protein
MNLDLLIYGNPTVEQLEILATDTYCDKLFNELSIYTFPKNSSDATKEELNQIVEYLNEIALQEEKIKLAKIYDSKLISYFKKGLEKEGKPNEEANKLIDEVIADTSPLLFKLKYHFQRPRPYQLASYYKLKLFPYKSSTDDSPSFPSGHAYQAKLLTEVIGNTYPETYSFMQTLFENICYSRMFMGLHYQSDIDVAIFAADRVLQMDEFKRKYKL